MAVIKKENSYMGLPMNIARGNPVPLDKSEIWYSRAEMENYAKTSVVAYVGQIIQLVDETENTATAFIIANTAGDLIEVGSSTLGDNKTIELTDEGVLRIVGSKDAKKGAQLVMGDNGIVTWVVPSTDTIDGLQTVVGQHTTDIADLKGRMSTAESDIDNLEKTLASYGGIFNFVGAKTSEEFININASDYDAGDVFLIDGVKEYVCVEAEDGTKRWEILGDPSGVTVLEGKVQTLEGKVSGLETWQAGANTDIANAQKDITDLKNKDTEILADLETKASASDLTALTTRVGTAEGAIEDIEGEIDAINTSLNGKATITYVDGKVKDLSDVVATKASQSALNDVINTMATDTELSDGLALKVNVSDYNTDKDALNTTITNVNNTATAAKNTAEQNATDIQALQTAVGKKAESSVVEALDSRVGKNESDISALKNNYNTLSGTVDSINSGKADKTALAATDANVAANAKAIADHAAEYDALEKRVVKAEADVIAAQTSANQGITDAAAAQTAADNAQTAADDAMAKAVEVLGTDADDASANTVFGAKAAAAAADAKAVNAQNEVDALEVVVNNLTDAMNTADGLLSGRIEAIENVIDGVHGAMHFVGISTTDPSAGSVVIDGKDDYVAADGDVVIYKDAENNSIEYIYSAGAWVELGDVSAEAKRIQAIEQYNANTVAPALAEIPGIKDDIDAQETAISGLLGRMTDVESANTTQDASIKALQDRAAAIEKSITDTAAAIRGELADEVKDLTDLIDAETSARTTAVNEINTNITNLTNMLTWKKFSE